jgi:DNA-binding NarL/FixJ family response regulator
MIRLALLDDHPAVLVGLQRVIEQEPDIVIVGAAPTAPALARQLGGMRADVLVVDHDVARSDGLSQSRRIKDRPHPPGVIIYSAFARQTLALPARVAHADAVVDKAEPVSTLLAAIRSVARGETMLPPVPRSAYDAATARLDSEDLPTFAMLLDGATVPAIAGALRAERDEVAWRAQRIIGRLRPGATMRADEREPEPAAGRVPELPFR